MKSKRRSKEEMISLITDIASKDARIHIVTLEGSRTNKNVKPDEYQDYDITFLVSDFDSFLTSDDWLEQFGRRIFMQKPEAMELFEPELGNWFSYLMLFEDTNRIDLTLVPLNELDSYLKSDKLIEVILDKDNLIAHEVVPSDEDYHVKKPSPQEFDDCCNEFWWVTTYVDKGIRRDEFTFAADHLNQIVRRELIRMISWKVGIETNFSLSIGKNAKYLKHYVTDDYFEQLVSTYKMDSLQSLRDSLELCMTMFSDVSKHVAEQLGFPYSNYETNIRAYLRMIGEGDLTE